jgi:hypothetical protein
VERNDGTVDRGPPAQMAVREVHGKHSAAIRLQDRPRLEISAHRDHVVVGGGGVG